MKFSELVEIVNNYDSALWSPSRMNVHFGCDCGCGGDSYTTEEWDEEERAAKLAVETAIKLCAELGIEYDGVV